MAVRGLERQACIPRRMAPASRNMLAAIRERLDPQRSGEGAAIWAALTLGWFFLMRPNELMGRWAGDNRAVRVTDVAPRVKGQYGCDWATDPDEMVLCIRYQKNKEQGAYRNAYATGTETFCPVRALANMHGWYPELRQHPEWSLFNNPAISISKRQLQRWLRLGAAIEGAPPSSIGLHSLRSGGASAMIAPGIDWAIVRRFGRWRSEAFHTYVWEHEASARGIAQKMSNAPRGEGLLHPATGIASRDLHPGGIQAPGPEDPLPQSRERDLGLWGSTGKGTGIGG